MRRQNYPVELNEKERSELEAIVKRGEHKRREIQRAQMLLWSAEGKSDLEIAVLLTVRPLTVAKTRERWVIEKRLGDAPKAGRHKKLNGQQEAFLVALACSDAPEGREVWTMQLLAERLVGLGIVEQAVSDETVRVTLKKTTSSPGKKNNGVSPQ